MALPLLIGVYAWLVLPGVKAFDVCTNEESCRARVGSLSQELESIHERMRDKHLTIKALGDLRRGVMKGGRVELPSSQRQYLEQSFPVTSAISFDARHKPVSTNKSGHLSPKIMLGPEIDVRLYAFLQLKSSAKSPGALLVVVNSQGSLSILNLESTVLIDSFDLGHGAGRTITRLVTSPTQDSHFVVTIDDAGEIRTHSLKVKAKAVKNEVEADDNATKADNESNVTKVTTTRPKKASVEVSMNFTSVFSLPQGASSEPRFLTSFAAVDRGTKSYYLIGDSLGGISVFHQNGTLKGRARVTEDSGGVLGLLRSQGQSVVYYSSHSFGMFSMSQLDVKAPPCDGWQSPVFDIAPDPTLAYNRVVVALTNGDVLVFSTTKGKSKNLCDLTMKFPHVSGLPFKLWVLRGHIMGIPTPPRGSENTGLHLRELFFFNLGAMDAGYGIGHSKAVTLQVDFSPKSLDSVAIVSTTVVERGKSVIAAHFTNRPGVQLYDLSLKQAATSRAAPEESEDSNSSWLNWFPKVGVFGIALVGVVIWNVRKATANKTPAASSSDFDDESFKERLKERREAREGEKEGSGEGGSSGNIEDLDEDRSAGGDDQ